MMRCGEMGRGKVRLSKNFTSHSLGFSNERKRTKNEEDLVFYVIVSCDHNANTNTVIQYTVRYDTIPWINRGFRGSERIISKAVPLWQYGIRPRSAYCEQLFVLSIICRNYSTWLCQYLHSC